MSLIRHLAYLLRQVLGYTIEGKRLGLLLLLGFGGVAVIIGLAASLAAPLALYPFL